MSFLPVLASKRERKIVLVISLLCGCSRYLYIHYLINQAICQPSPSRKIAQAFSLIFCREVDFTIHTQGLSTSTLKIFLLTKGITLRCNLNSFSFKASLLQSLPYPSLSLTQHPYKHPTYILFSPLGLFLLFPPQRQTTFPKQQKVEEKRRKQRTLGDDGSLEPRETNKGERREPRTLRQGGFACSFYYASIFLSIFFRASQIFRLRLFLQIVIHSKLSSSLQQLREGGGD